MQRPIDSLSECRDCGLLQRLPELSDGGWAACARCGASLARRHRQSIPLSVASAVAGLSLLTIGALATLATVSMRTGRFAASHALSGPETLTHQGAAALSAVVVLTLLVLPALKLSSIVAMGWAARRGRAPGWLRKLFARGPLLSTWSMVDVFLLGAAIALVRLGGWMRVELGPAMLAFGGLAVCLLACDHTLDPREFWKRVDADAPPPDVPTAARRLGCDGCGLVQRASSSRCRRCGHALRFRKPDSSPRTWALLAAAVACAVPANALPVMTISKAGEGGPSTILGGTLELVQQGFPGLAGIVFVASILIPLVKLAVLAALLVTTARRSRERLVLRTRAFRWVALVGRWSMLDIFATMTLAMMARFGWLGSVVTEAGASAFCAVVLLTMWAVETFDPRLMWDAAGLNGPRASLVPGRCR